MPLAWAFLAMQPSAAIMCRMLSSSGSGCSAQRRATCRRLGGAGNRKGDEVIAKISLECGCHRGAEFGATDLIKETLALISGSCLPDGAQFGWIGRRRCYGRREFGCGLLPRFECYGVLPLHAGMDAAIGERGLERADR